MIEELGELNPWWIKKDFETGVPRPNYLSKIEKYLGSGEITILSGVRRSGKSTLLFQTIKGLLKRGIDPKKILFVNLDIPAFSNLKNPIKEILDEYHNRVYPEKDVYLFLDEIQNVEGWERYLKAFYDSKSYKIVATGSSSQFLETKLSPLLSGRYLQLRVFPLGFDEYLSFKGLEFELKDEISIMADKRKILNTLNRYIIEGGFPRVALEGDDLLKADTLNNYLDAIVYKDIVIPNNVRNVSSLEELFYYLFSNITKPHSHNKLAKMFGIDNLTLKEYLNYATKATLLWELPFFSYSLKVQNRKNKKAYCIDNGLRNAASFSFSKDEGKLVENLVFVELLRRGKDVFYWDGKNGVDFVVKNKDNFLTAINVTYTNDIADRELQGLLEFKAQAKKTKDLILLTKDIERGEKGVQFIPLWRWLLRGDTN